MGTIIELLKTNYREYAIAGAIMVSAIIVFIGFLKPILFNKIKCKPLRKSLLALADVVFAFVATAIYFLIQGYTWENYYWGAAGVSICCIVAYWFYENTNLRTLVDKIGEMALRKFVSFVFFAFNAKEQSEIETEIKRVKDSLVKSTKNELKTASRNLKKDKELENL